MKPTKQNSLPIGILYWSSQITSVSFEVAFFVMLGYWGDQHWKTSPWLTLAGAGFGLLISSLHLWQLVQGISRMNRRSEELSGKGSEKTKK